LPRLMQCIVSPAGRRPWFDHDLEGGRHSQTEQEGWRGRKVDRSACRCQRATIRLGQPRAEAPADSRRSKARGNLGADANTRPARSDQACDVSQSRWLGPGHESHLAPR
jgi:hypothetical protein